MITGRDMLYKIMNDVEKDEDVFLKTLELFKFKEINMSGEKLSHPGHG